MGLMQKIGGAFKGLVSGWKGRRLQEGGGVPPFGGNIDTTGPAADRLFRQISGRAVRDLTDRQRRKQQRIAFWLYLGHPLAYRGLSITKDFVVGEGIHVEAVDPQIEDLLQKHWTLNEYDWWIENLVLELSLYGELFLTTHVSAGGQVRLGAIDPLDVVQVILDPQDGRTPRWVEVNPPNTGEKPVRLKVVSLDENPLSPTHGRLTGQVFYFNVNKITHQIRGNSDLLSSIDWIDQHEQLLFSIVEMARAQMAHVWDVEIKGARGKQLEEYRKTLGSRPKAGMVRLHSENVKFQAVSPNLSSGDTEALGRMLKVHIASSMGLPLHWLSEGGEAGRAAQAEMGVPTTKRLRNRQRTVRKMLERIFRYAIDQAIIANPAILMSVDSTSFTVKTPPIWPIDTQRITASMQTGFQALAGAQEAGWISAEMASKQFRFLMSQLDEGAMMQDHSETESESEADQEAAARALEKVNGQRDQLEQRMNAKDDPETTPPATPDDFVRQSA